MKEIKEKVGNGPLAEYWPINIDFIRC